MPEKRTCSTPAIPKPQCGKKITPGPYRATKLWNEIVEHFRSGMPTRRHRRHLKMHNECFTANEAIDFLLKLLKTNHNIGSEVTRIQTTQLLRKFLKNHVIEDIQGKWGTESVNDDNHLFRFPSSSKCTVDQSGTKRNPLGAVNENIMQQKDKVKRKSKYYKEQKRKDSSPPKKNNEDVKSTSSNSSADKHCPIRHIPQCKVTAKMLTEEEISNAWSDVVKQNIQKILKLDTLNDLVLAQDINGKWIKHNASNVGKSGVVQVPIDQDLPYWTLSAMTCLANWPNSKDTGLPCYPGFENDVFKAVCEYYCRTSNMNNNTSKKCKSKQNPEAQIYAEVVSRSSSDPLLTFGLYELFTNIICLLRPETTQIAIETLQYSLLLLPPTNRRKLHLLLRLMAKVSVNPHLLNLNPHMPTRIFLLHTFSRHILSCFEEVYLDELLAMRLVTFLIDHHMQVMKIPDDLKSQVEKKICNLEKPLIRYADGNEEGSFIQYSYFPPVDHVSQKHNLVRSKSVDVMKSLSLGRKSTPHHVLPLADSRYNKQQNERKSVLLNFSHEQINKVNEKPKHSRSSTFTTKVFNLKPKSSGGKSKMKPAQSCPDICDRMSAPTTNLPTKAFSGSNRNLKYLINKLRRNRL